MKISELIAKLELFKNDYGDIRLGSEHEFTVTGISYKFLIIKSNHPIDDIRSENDIIKD